MDYQKTLRSAKAALEQGNYSQASDICLSLINNGYNSPEIATISAISLLHSFQYPLSSNDQNTITNCLRQGAEQATALEEVCIMEAEFGNAYTEWAQQHLEIAVDRLISNPSYANYGPCYESHDGMFFLSTDMAIMTNDHVKGLRAQLSQEENERINEKYGLGLISLPDIVHGEEHRERMYQAGISIFEKAKSLLSKYFRADRATLRSVAQQIVEYFSVAELTVQFSIPPEKDKDGNLIEYTDEEKRVICERLKTQAEILTKKMNSYICPDGGDRISIWADEGGTVRANTNREIQAIYTRIKALDPSFIAPSLPSVTAYSTSNTQSSSSSSKTEIGPWLFIGCIAFIFIAILTSGGF